MGDDSGDLPHQGEGSSGRGCRHDQGYRYQLCLGAEGRSLRYHYHHGACWAHGCCPKTSAAFFCPEKSKGPVAGNFKHLRTLDKKNSNAIYWAPRGRFVVIATVHNQQSPDLDFFDLDFEGEKPESDKDLTANLQLMNTADHYGVTDVEWDPSGRFVATWASVWKHT